MELKELEKLRNRSQSVTNILKDDFDFKWDGIDYTLAKGKTEYYPFYLAEHCALHMARVVCTERKLNYTKEVGKIVDEIMAKEFIDYDKLTIKKARELAQDRKIDIEVYGKEKTKARLIQDLKDTH